MLCAAGIRFLLEAYMAIIEPPSSANAMGTSMRSSIRKPAIRIPEITGGLPCSRRADHDESPKASRAS
jgi:hypothetical protein